MLFIDSFRCYFLITLIVVSQFATKLDILFYMGKQYTEKNIRMFGAKDTDK